VAAWLAYSEKKTDVALVTKAGPRHCRVISQEGNTVHIATEMGVPTARNLKLTFEGGLTLDGVEVSVGNPHYIVFVETEDFSVNGIAWQQMGAKICAHKAFPHSTNAEFVRVVDKNTIAFRIFERGVGPTLSSGTGTCASATASIFSKGTARHLTVQAEGGDQIIHWPADDQPILLTGPATIIARGVAITS
jgi:diaminopimelate epimerase